MRILVFTVVAAFILCAGDPAMADEVKRPSMADMMAELDRVGQKKEELKEKIESSINLKNEHEEKFGQLELEQSQLAIEDAAIEQDRPMVNSLCIRTVDENQLAAAQAECDAVQKPFNERVDRYNERGNELQQEYAILEQAENERAAQANTIIAEMELAEARERTLRMAILEASNNVCVLSCNECVGNCENISQCLANCWDGALASGSIKLAPSVEAIVIPPDTLRRTPQQAIDEYRRSGPAPGQGPGLRTRAPPPPTPN